MRKIVKHVLIFITAAVITWKLMIVRSELRVVPEEETGEKFEAEDLTIDRKQCQAHLPLLDQEIRRAKRYWTWNKTLTQESIKKAGELDFCSTLQIVKGRLYIKIYKPLGTTARAKAMFAQIHRALMTMPKQDKLNLPNSEFVVCVLDDGVPRPPGGVTDIPAFVLARHQSDASTVAVPEFGFFSWPEPRIGPYQDVRTKAINIDSRLKWEEKKPKLFWKGAVGGIDPRGTRAVKFALII
jgi:hypothetical protein